MIDRFIECKNIDNNKLFTSVFDTMFETLAIVLTEFAVYIFQFGDQLLAGEMTIGDVLIGTEITFNRNVMWILSFIYVKIFLNMDNINNYDSYCNQQIFSVSNIIKLVFFLYYFILFVIERILGQLDI